MFAVMSEIGRYALFAIASLLFAVTFASFISFVFQGPGRIASLGRLGLSFTSWWRGELPKRDLGSSINTIEGLKIDVENGELKSIKQTRTLSSEI